MKCPISIRIQFYKRMINDGLELPIFMRYLKEFDAPGYQVTERH